MSQYAHAQSILHMINILIYQLKSKMGQMLCAGWTAACDAHIPCQGAGWSQSCDHSASNPAQLPLTCWENNTWRFKHVSFVSHKGDMAAVSGSWLSLDPALLL